MTSGAGDISLHLQCLESRLPQKSSSYSISIFLYIKRRSWGLFCRTSLCCANSEGYGNMCKSSEKKRSGLDLDQTIIDINHVFTYVLRGGLPKVCIYQRYQSLLPNSGPCTLEYMCFASGWVLLATLIGSSYTVWDNVRVLQQK